MITTRRIAVDDESQVGEARRAVIEICQRVRADETTSGQAAIVVTELAANLFRHAGRGEILLNELPTVDGLALEILAVDAGPGIANIAEALRDGYSTGGTAGNGLGAVRRLAAAFEVFTQRGLGTVVRARFGRPRESDRFEYGAVSTALEGEVVCGDAWDVMDGESGLRLVVADGLGHGPFASEAAREAVAVFRTHPTSSPTAVMEFAHLALGKTRGAAGAMFEILPAKREVRGSGIGNISMRLVSDAGSKSLVSDNGTLGGRARRAQESRLTWTEDAILVVHSDGLATQWSLDSYPGLVARHPSVIAAVLYRDFQRDRDDTTVVVVKERR